MKRRCLLLVVVLLSLTTLCPPAQAALQGGAAKVNITPPIGTWLSGYGAREKPSEGIIDDLYAKALVLTDGSNSVALISVDLLWVPLQMTQEIRKMVQEKTGIPGSNIMICSTHTHFGPRLYGKTKLGSHIEGNTVDDAYVQTLSKKIVDAVFLAHKDMQDVQVGANRGELTEIVYHRRPRYDDGSVTMAFSLPDAVIATREIIREPDGSVRVTFTDPPGQPLRTYGPIDPDLWVLRVETAAGEMLASMVNYACHAVSGSRYPDWFYCISADYPGETTRVVERIEGGVCLFTSGTAGDIVPLKRGKAPRYQIGRALAGAAIRGLQFLPMSSTVEIDAKTMAIDIPLKETLSEDRIVDADATQDHLSTEIQLLRLGDIYLLGLPGEILVEVGLEIKKRAGIEKLIIASLSNDVIGYVCHAAAYDEGGYESTAGTNLAKGAGEHIVTGALKLISQMREATKQFAGP